MLILIFLAIFSIILCVVDLLGGGRQSVRGGGNDPAIAELIDEFHAAPRLILTYDEIPESTVKYAAGMAKHDRNPHIGQRKLLMNEIQFMTLFDSPLCIYIGYAPCEHFVVLSELFPDLKFLLIDPNYPVFDHQKVYISQNPAVINKSRVKVEIPKTGTQLQKVATKRLTEQRRLDGSVFNAITNEDSFDLLDDGAVAAIMASPEKAFVIQDYMTADLATRIRRSLDAAGVACTFISDIRTNFFNSDGPTDLDILANDALQHVCIKLIEPVLSMLKFHPPYRFDNSVATEDRSSVEPYLERFKQEFGVDPVEEYTKGKYMAFTEKVVYIQPWGPRGTTEARLVVEGVPALRDYPSGPWEDRFYLWRFFRTYAHDRVFADCREYDHCMDCAIEQSIIVQYLHSRDDGQPLVTGEDVLKAYRPEMQKKIVEICRMINRHMTYDLHQKQKFKWHGKMEAARDGMPPVEIL